MSKSVKWINGFIKMYINGSVYLLLFWVREVFVFFFLNVFMVMILLYLNVWVVFFYLWIGFGKFFLGCICLEGDVLLVYGGGLLKFVYN